MTLLVSKNPIKKTVDMNSIIKIEDCKILLIILTGNLDYCNKISIF